MHQYSKADIQEETTFAVDLRIQFIVGRTSFGDPDGPQ